MTLSDLQIQAHATAVEKGWHDHDNCDHLGFGALLIRAATWLAKPWRKGPSAAQKLAWLALVTDELDEAALETELDYREDDGKPCGIMSEYADALIRILDMAGACGWRIRFIEMTGSLITVPGARNMLVDAIRAGSPGAERMLSVLFWAIVDDAKRRHGITTTVLLAMIETKGAFNRQRKWRHGGKLA